MNSFSFGKAEKLKSRKQIDGLFASGKSFHAPPVRMVWQFAPAGANEAGGLTVGVSASKRNFKKAVHRNRIKRLLREGYRLQKVEILLLLQEKRLSGHVFFLFTGKELPEFESIRTAVQKCLQHLSKKAHEAIA